MPPAAPPANVQTLCQLLVRSRLLSADETRSIFQRWATDSAPNVREDLEQFRRYLVTNRHLTEYQAGMVLRGHVDGFFIDQYKILDRIGKGRMAGVYKGMHPSGQMAAIKILPPSKARDANLLGRFQREAKLVTQLSHPNIVRSLATGESGGLHFIVMEHLEGDTVQEVLDRRKRLTPPEVIRIVYQVLQGLQQVHERGMVHRDLKPANMMLIAPPGQAFNPDSTLNCTAKILDIGLGRAFEDDDDKPQDQLTADGVLLGTPDYLAPEQARNAHNVDIRADIYSLGCAMFHMLTGQTPFPDTNVLSQVLRHATDQPKPLTEFLNAVPEGLQQVVSTMMAKDVNQRFQTPTQVAQSLKPMLGNPPDGSASSMSSYMTWLEGENRSTTSTRINVAKPSPGDEVTAEIPTGKLADRKKREPEPKRSTKRDKPNVISPEDIDVELVTIPPPPPSSADRPFTDFDRRDVIMLVSGGGGVFTAILIGLIAVQLLKPRPPATTPEEQAPPAIQKGE